MTYAIFYAIIATLVTTFALTGGWLRLLYGGAPHVSDPTKINKQLRGWLSKGYVDVGFYLLGVSILSLSLLRYEWDWKTLLGISLVSLASVFIWNPGHGSYLNPGNGSLDNETLFNKIVPWLSFRATPGSVLYCSVGMATRYGITTSIVGLVMLYTNLYLNTHFSPWFGAVGLLAGPIIATLHYLHWERWTTDGGWVNPTFANCPFEFAIGFTITAGLVLQLLWS